MSDRLSNETDKAWQAFQDFRDMGTTRTIADLQRKYAGISREKKGIVPTDSYKTLEGWAGRFNWSARVKDWDANEEKRRLEHLNAEKKEKWIKDAEAYRERNQRFGAAAFTTAIQCLNEATIALTHNPDAEPEKGKPQRKPKLTVDQATRLLGVLPRLVESSQSTEGTALGITQLLEEMGVNK